MIAARSLIACLFVGASLAACAEPVVRSAAPGVPTSNGPRVPSLPVAWGIPSFFEVGQDVRLGADGASVDTTGWPAAILRTPARAPRSYLSTTFDDQSSVFVYPELDPEQRTRRYAFVVPEPKTFSTNGLLTAFWGRTPLLMNFAPGAVRSFATFTQTSPEGTRRIPVRARLETNGDNPQELENVYELEDSRLDVFEHKGLVPGTPLTFLEFTIYDRDSTADDAEPVPVAAERAPQSLKVALTPMRDARFLHRRSFESGGYRVVLVSVASGQAWFLATPSDSRAGWGFGEVSTDLTFGHLDPREERDAGPGSAAALELARPTQGWLLCGTVDDEAEIPSLLMRGAAFRARMQSARRALGASALSEFAVHTAHAFVEAHRSQRTPRTFTRFAYGDAPQPSNSTMPSDGARYGRDVGSALRGLVAVQRSSKDPTLLSELAELAEFSLGAALPSGASLTEHFARLALLAERDEISGRSDVFIDNGSLAVAVNHRRLLLASSETHSPTLTWGAFSASIDGQDSSVDQAGYEFSVDGTSLPQVVSPGDAKLSISRLFTPESGAVRVRETAQLQRGFPALTIRYQLENRGQKPAALREARITLADFLDYGTDANEKSQGRYGLGHVVEGVHLPIAFWMEGMQAPLWSDSMAPGELDLTEQYRRLGARFLLVFGFDRAQLYHLERAPDRLILSSGPNGLSKLETRYELDTTLAPNQSLALPVTLTHTVRAPFASADGDLVPDQLQELAPLWARLVSDEASAARATHSSLDTDSGQAELTYAWITSAELFEANGTKPGLVEVAARLRRNALRAASFALIQFNELRNRTDLLPTYANGHDYGFHLAVFDWAYRETCDPGFRDAFSTLANDLVRSARDGGLQINDPRSPSLGAYLSTQQARASGATRVGDQGIRLWALRIAYERTGDPKYRSSAELFLDHWLRLDPTAHSFTGTVFARQRYRDAEVEEERSPSGHYAVLAGLKAWSDILPQAKRFYRAGLGAVTGRQLVHPLGMSGPYRLLVPRDGLADFSADADVGGAFLWSTTLDPSTLRGRFAAQCRREPPSMGSAEGAN